ncbi:unnamed protein product [Ixodes persulcatus]
MPLIQGSIIEEVSKGSPDESSVLPLNVHVVGQTDFCLHQEMLHFCVCRYSKCRLPDVDSSHCLLCNDCIADHCKRIQSTTVTKGNESYYAEIYSFRTESNAGGSACRFVGQHCIQNISEVALRAQILLQLQLCAARD